MINHTEAKVYIKDRIINHPLNAVWESTGAYSGLWSAGRGRGEEYSPLPPYMRKALNHPTHAFLTVTVFRFRNSIKNISVICITEQRNSFQASQAQKKDHRRLRKSCRKKKRKKCLTSTNRPNMDIIHIEAICRKPQNKTNKDACS